MQCPACPEVTLSMSNREGIEIDYCPKCRGVWLDRGELDKIIERSSHPTPAPQTRAPDTRYDQGGHSQGGYQQSGYKKYDDDDHRYGKRKRGFLGDIFDFD